MAVARREKRPNKSGKSKTPGVAQPTPRTAPQPPSLLKAILSGKALWVSLGLIALNLIVYWGVWTYTFVQWDDTAYITLNKTVQAGLTWESVKYAFTTGFGGNWHPLTWLSHMANIELFGLNAGGHHVSNLILHVAATLVLFGAFHGMTGALGRSAFLAGLFAVHPLHVESVVWVAERKDVLSTVFWMLTIWAYYRYTRQPDVWRYALVAFWFVLGLMSKPMLVTLPFTLLLMDVWPLGRLSFADLRAMQAPFVKVIFEKIPLFVLAAAASVITFMLQQQAGTVRGIGEYSLVVRLENVAVSYMTYIVKTLWPSGLAALYPLRSTIPAWEFLVSLPILIALSVAAIQVGRRHAFVPVGWLWYLGTLVPVIGFIHVGDQSMADRYTYVPSIGLFWIAAWGFPVLLNRWPQRDMVLRAGGVIVLAVLAFVGHTQAEHWKTNMAIWSHTLSVTKDNHRAENLMGDEFMTRGQLDEAIKHYAEGIRIKPDYPNTHNGYGNALERIGKADEAMKQYQEAVRLSPGFAEAQNNLGNAYFNRGDFADAVKHYTEAVRLSPYLAEAHNNLANALIRQGRFDDAIREYALSLQLAPDPDVEFNLALAYMDKGDMIETGRHLEAALRLNPNHAPSRTQLDQLRSSGRLK